MTSPDPRVAVVTLRGVNYQALPLNFDALEALYPRIEAMREKPDFLQNLRLMRDAIFAAISQADKTVTMAEITASLDLTNATLAFATVMEVSGLKAVQPGEVQASA